MSVEQLAGIAAIITAFFSGLGVCLRLLLQVTKQIRDNTHNIASNTRQLNGSTKVPGEDHPPG